MTLLIICGFILIFGIGFFSILRRLIAHRDDQDFATEYRNKFVAFANTFLSTYDRFSKNGTINNEIYVWLTKSVTRIQNDLGHFGVMDYIGPFQQYHVPNYQIVINCLPKFRDQNIESFDIHSVDDCLLRYIGNIEELIKSEKKKIKNPIIWFQEGIQLVISLPLYIFHWFGIITERTISRTKNSLFYKLLSGIGALVAFASGLVTIILGKEETIELFKKIFSK